MTLSQISGDSSVEQLSYVDGVAELHLRDGDTDESVFLRVPTRLFYSEAASEHGSVHVCIFPLAEHLPVQQPSGRYVAPDTFEQQMLAIRGGLHLAYGLRAAEFPLFLRVAGYRVIFACPLAAEHQVTVA